MKLQKLILDNFRGYKTLELNLERDVTVIIGDNGSGKTTLLDAIAQSLGWFIARIKTESGKGSPISELDIHNGTHHAQISLQISALENTYEWSLAQTRQGRKKTTNSQLSSMAKLAETYREQLTEDNNSSLPLLVYYPVDRVVTDISVKLSNRQSFGQLDAYTNAVNGNTDFNEFFKWFRNQEDIENEKLKKISIELEKIRPEMILETEEYFSRRVVIEKIKINKSGLFDENGFLVGNKILNQQELINYANQSRTLLALEKNKKLEVVRSAITKFLPNFSHIQIQRSPRLSLLIDKQINNEIISLDANQLSRGEKCLLAMVGDLARRLAILNPTLEDPLQGEGIVLIDEIDLHLHPRWQRSIISNLRKTFPNIQFIISTHSALVISDAPNINGYLLKDGKLLSLDNLYGMDVNQVLLQEMDTDIRNINIQNELDNLRDLLQDNNIDAAKIKISQLEQQVSTDNLELNKARLLLRRLELRRA